MSPTGGAPDRRATNAGGPDLTTTYVGLLLRSPLVASASPITRDAEKVVRLAEAGAGAVVMPSLFEEEILHDEIELSRALEAGAEHFPEALDYFPAVPDYDTTADRYLSTLRDLKAAVRIPVIASLNAASSGAWIRYARLLEEAGADALELNLYRVAADPDRTAAEMEGSDLRLIADVRAAVGIPLAVKLSPHYTAFANFARRVVEAGAEGLVLFNRFFQPDLDLETLDVVPRIELSHPWEMRLPLRWIAILRPQLVGTASLAATTGVHSGLDAAKLLLVGADVVMTTSALLHSGPERIGAMEAELLAWMTEREYESVAQLRGSVSRSAAEDPAAFERANYVRTLYSWTAPTELTPSSPTG
ncbi:MAG TPA: dihydroorotate dehydrogenase-like protein [Actinomycetota bacterium]|nr:dihydroorotate dehydrogenase-like protein [Actinomycetota bacterium]